MRNLAPGTVQDADERSVHAFLGCTPAHGFSCWDERRKLLKECGRSRKEDRHTEVRALYFLQTLLLLAHTLGSRLDFFVVVQEVDHILKFRHGCVILDLAALREGLALARTRGALVAVHEYDAHNGIRAMPASMIVADGARRAHLIDAIVLARPRRYRTIHQE
jgi:hypothetical protein